MKKWFLTGLALCILMPQAYGVALLAENGDDLSDWTIITGEWESVDGAIVRTGVQQGNHTHALVKSGVIDLTKVTFPVTLTYDLKTESDTGGSGEVWTGIGIGGPAADASNIEDGAVIVAVRDNNGAKGLNFLVGGRQWAQGDANFDWQPDTWYTMRVVLTNPDFAANKVDIEASLHEKGGEAGVYVTGAGIPASGNAFELSQTSISIFSRGSAEGIGGMRSFDNIVLEAANVPGGSVAYQNDGTSVSEFTQVKGVFEVVDGAIVRTDPVAPDTTQGAMLDGVANMEGNDSVSLEYDIKVETITTQGDETWSGIALFAPAADAGNIEDGAVIMTMRDGGAGSDQGRGLHALLGGRAWLSQQPNLFWKADTWYHMSVTVTNA
ncbi:MAG: hypothetical protein ACP5I1_04425, partial [Candidatus Hinthialibacter sp.]